MSILPLSMLSRPQLSTSRVYGSKGPRKHGTRRAEGGNLNKLRAAEMRPLNSLSILNILRKRRQTPPRRHAETKLIPWRTVKKIDASPYPSPSHSTVSWCQPVVQSQAGNVLVIRRVVCNQ